MLMKLKYRDSHIKFYRAVMRKEVMKDPQGAVGGNWEHVGAAQLERLIVYGLQPNNSLLDVGCGSLRGGLHIIKYLETSRYTGTDISEEALQAGKKFLIEAELEYKKPSLIAVNSLDFRELNDQTFDYINAQSVFSQMPKGDVEELLSNLHKVMHPKSIFFATFAPSQKYRSYLSQHFQYPLAWFKDVCANYGLSIEEVKDIKAMERYGSMLIKITLSAKA